MSLVFKWYKYSKNQKDSFRIYFSLICAISLISLFSCVKNDKHQIIKIEGQGPVSEYKLPYLVNNQPTNERVFKELKVEQVQKFDSDLYMPVRVQFYDSSVYVLDQADGFVKKFNLNRHLSDTTYTKLGPGKGSGPGETSIPFDMDIDTNGNIYILDHVRRAILKWSKNGLPIKDVFFQQVVPFEITVLDSNMVIGTPGISTTPFENSSLFMQINFAEGETGYLGEFLTNISSGYENEAQNPYVGIQSLFIGNTLFTGKNIIFVPDYMSQIMIFDDEANPINIISTIEPEELPILKRQSNGGISLYFNTKRLQSGVFECAPDSFCVLSSNSYTNQPGSIVLDVYESQNGYYKFSYFVENIGRFYILNMNQSHLATINEEMEVTVWKIIQE